MTYERTQILISGGGIAGLTAAAAFGGAGFDVVLVDPAPPVTDVRDAAADLRTTAFLQPSRDFLDRIGLWDGFAAHATPLQIMRIADAAQDPPLIRDFDAADISDRPFGWNLPNAVLRREIMAWIAPMPNVALRTGTGFAGMVARTNEVIARLDDGTTLRCDIVIGADGRGSPVRMAAGIDAKTTRYGQKAIVFAVTHTNPHDNVSTEVHRDGGPFTLVPLPDHNGLPCSSVVWMADGATIARLAALDDAAFAATATERSANLYGPLALASRRTVWPIISQIADRMIAARTALVAEAAHVVPPIGAQGLNMSLADLDCLLELAQSHRADLGGPAMLDAYQRARYGDITLRVRGIDALNRASIAGGKIAHDARAAGIRALAAKGPLRSGLMQLGLGAKG